MRGAIVPTVVVPLVLAMGVVATGATVVAMRPTLAEFIAKADAVCDRDDADLSKLRIGTSMATMNTFGATLARSTTKTISGLRVLARPPGTNLGALLDQMGRAAAYGRAISRAATERKFPDAAEAGTQMSSAYERADDLARELGLKECGRTASRIAGTGAQGAPVILKQGFLNDVNAQCRAAFEKDLGPEPTSLPELSSYLAATVAEATNLNNRLRQIAPPPAEKQKADAVFASFETLVVSAGHLRDAAQSGALTELDARFLKFAQDTAAANIKADQYGFNECGSGGEFLATS